MYNQYLQIASEIEEALDKKQAVVALESTIISHGMPYPQNVETALEVEQTVRRNGAIPATIALMDGKLKVGLTTAELTVLGKKGQNTTKTSRRDVPFVLAKKLNGSTTVAATMLIASMAGIHVFATGGIGGVHRGANETMDISADLQELSRTNVAVVCAGAKAILDLPLTMEYLETQGVPVIGFQTEHFPAFYLRESGLPVDYMVDNAKELAQALKIKWDMGLQGGVVVANPIPEQYEMQFAKINQAVNQALESMKEQGIKGKAITPFLLSKIEELTQGASLKANIQLIYHNAKVAASLAKAYAELGEKS